MIGGTASVGQTLPRANGPENARAQAAADAIAPLPPQPRENVNRQLMLWKVTERRLTDSGLLTKALLLPRWVWPECIMHHGSPCCPRH